MMTLEAVVIVPMVILITAALMGLTFFVHNRNYYIAAGYEAALTANAWHSPQEDRGHAMSQKAAGERAKARIENQPFPGTEPEEKLTFAGNLTKVSFSGQKFPGFPEGWFEWKVQTEAMKVRPVVPIRLARVARKAAEKWKKAGKDPSAGTAGGSDDL